jgi:hypothetical protein
MAHEGLSTLLMMAYTHAIQSCFLSYCIQHYFFFKDTQTRLLPTVSCSSKVVPHTKKNKRHMGPAQWRQGRLGVGAAETMRIRLLRVFSRGSARGNVLFEM